MNRWGMSSTQRIETERGCQIEVLEKKWVTEMKNNFNGPDERINTAEE